MIEELDLEMDSFVRTAKGGIVILAQERHSNKRYKLQFNRNDFEWLVGKEI
jgi:hypothetical protein